MGGELGIFSCPILEGEGERETERRRGRESERASEWDRERRKSAFTIFCSLSFLRPKTLLQSLRLGNWTTYEEMTRFHRVFDNTELLGISSIFFPNRKEKKHNLVLLGLYTIHFKVILIRNHMCLYDSHQFLYEKNLESCLLYRPGKL